MRLLADLLHLVLPDLCLGCGRTADATHPRLSLCRACAAQLAAPGPGCPTCGRPLAAAALPEGYRCAACRSDPPAFDRLITLWRYQPPFDAVIAALKFRRLEYLGAAVAQAVADKLGPEIQGCDVVVPVPLHWRRRLLRGYNQAERIARPLAELLGLPLGAVLARRRWVRAQMSLGRAERLQNARGTFRCTDPMGTQGRAVLLVDDVATTGATLRAAADCLRRGGARRVLALAAGLTPWRPVRAGKPA